MTPKDKLIFEQKATIAALQQDIAHLSDVLQMVADGLPGTRAPHRFSEARKLAADALIRQRKKIKGAS